MIFAPAIQNTAAAQLSGAERYNGATYYDQPALNPTSYGWLISAYFFVGGLGSAAEFLATVIDLLGRPEDQAAVRAGRYTALAGALVSPPLLIADLHTPQRWYNMLRIFRKTSAMSIGSWALSGFGLFSGLAAFGQGLADLFDWPLGRWIARLAGLPAALAGGVVAIYTGTLLAATNIPMWAASFPYLSSLFASSAASTAVAALSLLTPNESTRRRLNIFAVISGLAELFFAARIDQHWRRQRVESPRQSRPIFLGWRGVFGLGILLPLALHLAQLFQKRDSRSMTQLAAISALIGGFLLRAVFVFGDRPSVRRPEEYFRMTQRRP